VIRNDNSDYRDHGDNSIKSIAPFSIPQSLNRGSVLQIPTHV
jgi:hypothetical protein